MKQEIEKIILEEMVREGYNIDYGQLSLCTFKTCGRPKYQVYCENYKYPEAKVFNYNEQGLSAAIELFLNIKDELKKDGLRNSRRRNKTM